MATADGRSVPVPTNRGANIALWVLQSLLAVAFLGAGGAKLAGADPMVQEFEAIGAGQWFRDVTGVLEVVGAILLVIPGKSGYGALLVSCVMVGAVAVHVLVFRNSPVAPLVLLALLSVIVWARLVRGPKANALPEATGP